MIYASTIRLFVFAVVAMERVLQNHDGSSLLHLVVPQKNERPIWSSAKIGIPDILLLPSSASAFSQRPYYSHPPQPPLLTLYTHELDDNLVRDRTQH